MNIPNRLLLFVYYLSYLGSFAILLIASLSKSPLPSWGGYSDVGLVVLIVVLGFIIFGRGRQDPNFEISHRAALYLLPIVLLGMWIFRNAFDFNILLPGLAWRTFFFLHILPYALGLWGPETKHE